MNETIKYWVELADYDIITAEVMLASGRLLYVGFMCHQVIEKSLKAVFIKITKENPPFIHNLNQLAIKSEIINEMNGEQLNLLDELVPLNIEARYPTYKEELFQNLDYKYCEELLGKTRELLEWIKNRL